jgi:integration host factor subunit alpha
MTITKADLAESIYKRRVTLLTKKEATEAVESILSISKGTLISGSALLLSGFGKFNVNDKKARRGRNPQTGESLMLSERRVVTFHPSGKLRSMVNSE